MKKNLLMVTLLVIAVAFASGCNLMGTDDAAVTATTTAAKTALAGGATLPAAAGAVTAAPGRNFAPSAANYIAVVVDEDDAVIATDNTLVVSAGKLAYNFDITTYNGKHYFIELRHKATGKVVQKKSIGVLVAPATAGTITGCDTNAASTAKAAMIKNIIKKTTKTAAETAVAKATISADTTTAITTSPAENQFGSVIAAAGNTLLTNLLAALEKQVELLNTALSAIENKSATEIATVISGNLDDPDTIQTSAVNTLKITSGAVKTLLDAQTAVLGAIPVITNTDGTATNVTIGTTDVTNLTQVTTATVVDTATATATVPYITSATVNGKTVYNSTTGVAAIQSAGQNTAGTATIVINFSDSVAVSASTKIKIRITETMNSVVTKKTVVYGSTPATGEISWTQAFGTATPTIANNALTLAAGSGTYKLGKSSTGYGAATFMVELLQMDGIYKTGSQTVLLAAPNGTIGYFTLTK